GLVHLEASISVGAQLALNFLDLAQGSVSIMAGITFTIQQIPNPSIAGQMENDISLTAFLRLHGELDVLGLISVSVTLSVSMTYDFTNKMIIAEAEIQVAVSVLFFSTSV